MSSKTNLVVFVKFIARWNELTLDIHVDSEASMMDFYQILIMKGKELGMTSPEIKIEHDENDIPLLPVEDMTARMSKFRDYYDKLKHDREMIIIRENRYVSLTAPPSSLLSSIPKDSLPYDSLKSSHMSPPKDLLYAPHIDNLVQTPYGQEIPYITMDGEVNFDGEVMTVRGLLGWAYKLGAADAGRPDLNSPWGE